MVLATESYFLDQDRPSAYQLVVLLICMAINLIDAYDLMVISYAAPGITGDWGLDADTLGIIFGAGFVGMAIGSILVGPLADRCGRRTTIVWGLTVITVAMFLQGISSGPTQMAVLRVITGAGIGGVLPSVIVLVAEYSPGKYRNLAVGILGTSFPLGALIAGFVAIPLLELYDWRSLFFFGSGLSALSLLLVLTVIPESVEYLTKIRPKHGLTKLNRILKRTGYEALEKWPALKQTTENEVVGVKGILTGRILKWSLMFWLIFFCTMLGTFFITSWLPTVIVAAGLSLENAIYISLLNSAGSVAGILWLGYLTAKRGLRQLVALFLLLSSVFLVILGSAPPVVWLLMTLSFVLGIFNGGSLISLYTTGVRLYGTRTRATGLGWGIGMGRLGAIIGPVIAGILISFGWPQPLYFAAMSIPLLLAAFTMYMLKSERLDAVMQK